MKKINKFINKDFFRYRPFIEPANVIAILFILLVTLTANWSSIFSYESMYLDDLSRFNSALQNQIHEGIKERNYLRAYAMYIAYELMTVDLSYARFLFGLLMSLQSFLIYLLLVKLGFGYKSAVLSSIVPNIVIEQTMLPSFVDGSYVILGSTVATLSLLMGLVFCEVRQKRYLFFAALCYVASIELMDHAIFLFPAFTLFFLLFKNRTLSFQYDRLLIVFLFGVYAVYKTLKQLTDPVGVYMQPQPLGVDEMLQRVADSVFWVFPIANANIGQEPFYLNIVLLGLVVLVIMQVFIRMLFAKSSISTESKQILLISAIWILGSCLIFWVKAPYFSSRNFYVASLAVCFLVCFLLTEVGSGKSTAIRAFSYILFFIWIPFTVVAKEKKASLSIENANRHHSRVTHILESNVYPDNSQIAVIGHVAVPTGGYWTYSSYYFRSILDRPDVSGFIGNIKTQFYNPFDPTLRAYKSQMTGLDTEKPIFIYKLLPDGTSKKIDYALEWKSAKWIKAIPGKLKLGAAAPQDLRKSDWSVYKFDLVTGASEIFATGSGLEAFDEFLTASVSRGITEEEIAWAGPMSLETLNRFGL